MLRGRKLMKPSQMRWYSLDSWRSIPCKVYAARLPTPAFLLTDRPKDRLCLENLYECVGWLDPRRSILAGIRRVPVDYRPLILSYERSFVNPWEERSRLPGLTVSSRRV